MYQFDENGVLIPGSFQPGINSSGYGMSQDPNAVPPTPGVTIPQMSTPMSPNLVAGPAPGEAPAGPKKAGNLTEQQAAALGKLMEAPRMPNAPAAAAAIPRGPQGNMQQLQMGAPAQRKTLAQLLYR